MDDEGNSPFLIGRSQMSRATDPHFADRGIIDYLAGESSTTSST